MAAVEDKCDLGCQRGRPKCARCIHAVQLVCDDEDIQRTVDAVSGATWGKRNAIMSDLFFEDLDSKPDALPSYRQPGCE